MSIAYAFNESHNNWQKTVTVVLLIVKTVRDALAYQMYVMVLNTRTGVECYSLEATSCNLGKGRVKSSLIRFSTLIEACIYYSF